MAQLYRFTDENGQTRLLAEIDPAPGGSGVPDGWTQTGNPADVESNGGGLNVELVTDALFLVTDLDSSQTVVQVTHGAVTLRSTAPNTYFSGGLNNLDLSMPSAIGRLTLDDFSGNDLVKILDGGKLGFFGAAPVVKPTVAGAKLPGDVVMASLLTALVALGLVTDTTT